MADKPGEIEREIEEKRREISAKIDRLTERVSEDIRSARSEAGERTRFDQVDSLVHEHPFTSVAFAFGLGAVLGGITPSAGTIGHAGGDVAGRSAAMAGAGGGLLGSLVEPLRQPIQEEVSRFVRQAAAGFGGDGRNGHRPAEEDH